MDEVDSVVEGRSISTEGNIKLEKLKAHFVCKVEHLRAPRVWSDLNSGVP